MNRLSEREGVELLTHGDPIELGRQADAARRELFDDTVTFIVDRNINYTNVCKNECRFCAFFRRQGHKDAYLLTYDEILEKVRETVEAGGTQVMIQGGLYPDLGLGYYEKMLRLIKTNFPSITIHSFTATENPVFCAAGGHLHSGYAEAAAGCGTGQSAGRRCGDPGG
jgi:cyclic dehypoxanthinyl futalosine synthase